jgi:hypothetical protein
MSERWSSFFILLGVVLVVLALWYLSVRAILWDTRRRGMKPFERKAWIAATIVLPLFGFALYLFARVLRGYLAPMPGGGSASVETIDMKKPAPGLRAESLYNSLRSEGGHTQSTYQDILQQAPMPEPAWGKTNPAHSNGKAHAFQTPETTRAAYQPLRARYSLVVVQGPLAGQQFILKSLPSRIGRGPDSGVALDADLNISRKHAEIYEWNGMLRIRDLGSLHGTQINGVTVKDQALTPGDRITLGGTMLILREIP